jgi:hypothetical protein
MIRENRILAFRKQVMPEEERVQQQSGGWAITGQMPVPSEGWTPFKT